MMRKKLSLLKGILYTSLFSIIAPIFILLIWSFASRWTWPSIMPEGFSLRAIEELFGPHSKAMSVLFSSIGLSLTVAILAAVIGMMTARALVFYDFKGRELISFASIMPIIVPGTVFAMGIHVVFIRMGLADTVLGVILVHIIYALPYTINIMVDLTRSLGVNMEVQAYVLGVSPKKAFTYVTFPLLLPGFMSAISIGYIISFSQYFLTLIIGGGSVKTYMVMMVPFIQGGDRSISSAYALLFVLATLMVFMIVDFSVKKFAFWHRKME